MNCTEDRICEKARRNEASPHSPASFAPSFHGCRRVRRCAEGEKLPWQACGQALRAPPHHVPSPQQHGRHPRWYSRGDAVIARETGRGAGCRQRWSPGNVMATLATGTGKKKYRRRRLLYEYGLSVFNGSCWGEGGRDALLHAEPARLGGRLDTSDVTGACDVPAAAAACRSIKVRSSSWAIN